MDKVRLNTRQATCDICKLTARNEEELKDHMVHAHNYSTQPDHTKNTTNSTRKETQVKEITLSMDRTNYQVYHTNEKK